ncbi:MAG: LptF/LptG family permease [Planctomycetes bacterium]|nr:LptF/LptG family permease [Planctomycetota bacterium]
MTILDRMLFFSFIRAYCICLTSTLSLYIIVDMFTNLDDFGVKADGFTDILNNIAHYYGYRVIQYYDRLCEAIALLGAMFTISWMQRNNELLPVLSTGVSTHRVLRPILFGAAVALGIGIGIQELVIPRIAPMLMTDRDDPGGDKDVAVHGAFDSSGVHMEGSLANRKELVIKPFYSTLPESASTNMIHLSAASAKYIPPSSDPLSGGWLMTGTTQAEIENDARPEMLIPLFPGKYFLRTRDADFETMTRHPKWYVFTSTRKLYTLLNKPEAPRQGPVAVMFHTRISRFFTGMLLVVLGLSIILRDQTRHVFISAGLCLLMCGIYFSVVLFCKFLGDGDYLSPALSAWMPVLIFGPYTLVQYDSIHT